MSKEEKAWSICATFVEGLKGHVDELIDDASMDEHRKLSQEDRSEGSPPSPSDFNPIDFHMAGLTLLI